MSNNQIIAALGQMGRKEQFRLITTLEIQPNSTLVAKKTAYTRRAQPHLLQLVRNYDTIQAYIQKKTSDVALAGIIKKTNNALYFEYIDGDSAETLLLDVIIKNDQKRAKQIIKDIFDAIDLFTRPVGEASGGDAPDFLADIKRMQDEKMMRTAILDCNFDNFVYGKKLTLIDYEWVFPATIPSDLIKTRALVMFFERYFDALSFVASPNRPFLQINAHTALLVPEFIASAYKDLLSKEAITRFVNFEHGFQQFVNGRSGQAKTDLQYHTILVNYCRPTMPDSFMHNQNDIRRLEQETSELKEENAELRQKLQDILESRSWKLLQRVQGAKGRLGKLFKP